MASAAFNLTASTADPANGPARRRAERLLVLLPGKLTILDGHYDCAIENVSQTGARLIADVPLKVSQQGILQCYPLEELFSVVWTEGKALGIQFDEEVTLGTIRALRWHNDRFREHHDEHLTEIVQDWATGKRR